MSDLTALQAAMDAAKSAFDAAPEDAALKSAFDIAEKAFADGQKSKSKKSNKATEARVIVASAGYAVNDIITGDEADEAIAGGWADQTKAAVDYAKSLA